MSLVSNKYEVEPFVVARSDSDSCPAKFYEPLKKNLYITYNHTSDISRLIQTEFWGSNAKNLFSYLDYTFRARVIDDQIRVFNFKKNNLKIAVYNTALKNKNNHFVFLVLKPNDEFESKQKWTLKGKVDEYCLTKEELNEKYGIKNNDIPDFRDFSKIKKHFDSSKNVEHLCANWRKNFKHTLNQRTNGNCRKLILAEFRKNEIFVLPSKMLQELTLPFESAVFKAINSYEYDNSHILPGLYFDKGKYQVITQLLLDVYYQSKITKFAIIIELEKDRYVFKKVLSINMARRNARLISSLPKRWQHSQNEIKKIKEKISDESSCSDAVSQPSDVTSQSSDSPSQTSPSLFSFPSVTSLSSSSSINTLSNNELSNDPLNSEKMQFSTSLSVCEKKKNKIHETKVNSNNKISTNIFDLNEFEFKDVIKKSKSSKIRIETVSIKAIYSKSIIIETVKVKIFDSVSNRIIFNNLKSFSISYDTKKLKIVKKEIVLNSVN